MFEQRLLETRQAQMTGDLERVRREAKRLWEDLEGREMHRLTSEVAGLRSNVCQRTFELDRAETWGERAVALGKRCEDPEIVAEARREIGWSALKRGQSSRAREEAERALDALGDEGNDYQTLDLKRLRARAMMVREPERGRRLMEQVRRGAADAGYLVLEGMALNGLSEVARGDGNLERASRLIEEQIDIYRQVGERYMQTMAELNLAGVELERDRIDRADALRDAASERLESLGRGDVRRPVRCLIRLATAVDRGEWSRFDEVFEELEERLSEEESSVQDYPRDLERVADMCEERGADRRAARAWQWARRLWDELERDEEVARVEGRLDRLRASDAEE